MTPPAGLDAPNIVGLGVVGLLLVLMVRSWWRQDDQWRGMLDAAREDSRLARADAQQAREDAQAAREAEHECRRRLDEAFARIVQLESRLNGNG